MSTELVVPAAPGSRPPAPAPDAGRDVFWDAARGAATVRVIAWHTWGWTWLSWIAAMPAMFFTSGTMLARADGRRTVGRAAIRRLRRLLVPFWAYSAVAIALMTLDGWRPSAGELWRWALPVWDPTGPADMAMLWIPLWYVRTYLWIIVLAPVVTGVARSRVATFAWSAVAVAWAAHDGSAIPRLTELPMPVSDFVVFGMFVVLGARYGRRFASDGAPRRVLLGGAAIGATATAWAMATGRLETIVNSSYVAQITAGLTTVALLLAGAPLVRRLTARGTRLVDFLARRALGLYLWQGLGLLVADRVVGDRLLASPLEIAIRGAVTFGVTVAAATITGPLEDLAAGRVATRSIRPNLPAAASSAAAIAAAIALPAPLGGPTIPLSGAAVLAAAERVEESLQEDNSAVVEDALTAIGAAPSTSSPTATSPPTGGPGGVDEADIAAELVAALDRWVTANPEVLSAAGTTHLELSLATADGGLVAVLWDAGAGASPGTSARLRRFDWESMTKMFTAGWLSRSVEQGLVRFDDPVGSYVDGIPHGDRITLEMLARHRSGIPSAFDTDGTTDVGRQLRTWMDDGRLVFEPGTGFEYSRAGYTLLAWALEEATGSTWQETMEALAESAGASVTTGDDPSPTVANHHPGDGTYRGGLYAGAGLGGTVGDAAAMARWLFGTGLSPDMVRRVTAGTTPSNHGIGLALVCPCAEIDGAVRGVRWSHPSGTGWVEYDPAMRAAVALTGDGLVDAGGLSTGLFVDLPAALWTVIGERGVDTTRRP